MVARDPLLAPHFVGGAGGLPRFGDGKAEFERKASIAARIKLCYELLRQRRWREMRGGLAQIVSEQGELPTDLYYNWHFLFGSMRTRLFIF